MNIYAFAGEFVGGLIVAYLFSRLILWILRRYERSLEIFAATHLLSIMLAAIVGAISDSMVGAGIDIAERLAAYALPQIVWFSVDVLRLARRTASAS